ncbi:hypothetical protein WR25_13111 [Diploscapter pachys]|uniref:Cation-transporting ATPase n=1 Tax=Diploscapter pachys TaxID=2018661 RepID=A0A2A2M1E2_9BILA|nr:hypothetical protein WR25_13111 [Diploscapter pachys]
MGELGGVQQRHHVTLKSADHILQLYAYRSSPLRLVLLYIFSFLTLGIFRLILHWRDEWNLALRAVKCTFDKADFVYIVDDHNVAELRKIHSTSSLYSEDCSQMKMPRGNGQMKPVEHMRWFSYRKMRYVFVDGEWKTSNDIDVKIPVGWLVQFAEENKGFGFQEVASRLWFYGQNLIEVKLRPIFILLFMEIITPFYIFQIFSVSVWYSDEYAYYASMIVIMSAVSIIVDVYQTRSQEKRLRSMIHSTEKVEVIRDDGKVQSVGSEKLVPGDILLLPAHGCILPCDCVLMNGTVIVNESMLTGESVPVTKVAITDDGSHAYFSYEKHSKHILYCGTQVLQSRYYQGQKVKAIVLHTAYSTLKGQLVRSIMYPKPVDFRFTKDLFKFIMFLGCISGCGFLYTMIIMRMRGSTWSKVITRALDIITITVPPALPAAMSVGIINAQIRLRKKQIYCISPSTINTCGAINVVCFDKTGTLTEDGLDFYMIRPVVEDSGDRQFGIETTDVRPEMQSGDEIIKALACCHSLTRINGLLHGDPLDLILFQQAKWSLEEAEPIDESTLFDNVQVGKFWNYFLYFLLEFILNASIRELKFDSLDS